jgi:cytochrome c-type biogenesis protein CcmH
MNLPPVEGGERFEPVPGRLFVTPYDNDPFVVGVETKLKCTCGCLHNVYECRSVDFSCSLWPQHHADIVQQATAGWTGDEIIAYHLDNYGVEYLMAPAARGFNLVAYLLPGTLIAIVGTLIALYLRRTTQVALVGGPAVDNADLPRDRSLSEEDAGLLEEELQHLDW